eukprot:symbB.v1.2.023997.t1/scaffold2228.1/size107706/9
MQAVDTSCWRTIVKADKVDIDTNGVCVLLNLERLYYFVLVQDFPLTLDCQPMRRLLMSRFSMDFGVPASMTTGIHSRMRATTSFEVGEMLVQTLECHNLYASP